MSNRWNPRTAALYGAAACVIWTASKDVAWWGWGADYIARAIGEIVGAALLGAVIGFAVANLRNLWLAPKRTTAPEHAESAEYVDLATGQTCVGGAHSVIGEISGNTDGRTNN